jgi:hypothetical protein
VELQLDQIFRYEVRRWRDGVIPARNPPLPSHAHRPTQVDSAKPYSGIHTFATDISSSSSRTNGSAARGGTLRTVAGVAKALAAGRSRLGDRDKPGRHQNKNRLPAARRTEGHDLLKAFPRQYRPDRPPPPDSGWAAHLPALARSGLDLNQVRSIVRVLSPAPSPLALIWNWQQRGVGERT